MRESKSGMSGELILVVEDNADLRRSIEEAILSPAGYTVHSAEDGMSALAMVGEFKPDLVLTDNQMPNLTGIELIKKLQDGFPEIPTILMTSDGSSRIMLEAIRAGAVDFLSKPFDAEYLLSAVGRAINRGRRLQNQQLVKQKAGEDAVALERRLKEFETLALIGRTVTALLEIDTVLTTVVEEAVKLTGAEEGSLLLLDEDSGELYMRASQNFDEDFANTFRLAVGPYRVPWLLEHRVPRRRPARVRRRPTPWPTPRRKAPKQGQERSLFWTWSTPPKSAAGLSYLLGLLSKHPLIL